MDGGDFAFLAMPFGLAVFGVLAHRYGVDSRDGRREPRRLPGGGGSPPGASSGDGSRFQP